MAMYKSQADSASSKLMYDQGEDRWLCTLILLSGGRIEYEAGSHCLTYAPEDLPTFYKQRRRWGPSTAVNIFELIKNSKQAISRNPYITSLYIGYQMLFLILQTISITTTMMIIWEALELGSNLSNVQSGIIVFTPIAIFIIICYKGQDTASSTI